MPIAALALLASAGPLTSQQAVLGRAASTDALLTVEKYLDYETVAGPRISPDGSQIVYIRRWVDKSEDTWESAIWIMNADGSRNRSLVEGSSPVWSPDGTRIAYLSEGDPEETQIWVKYIDEEGPGTQVTRVSEVPGDLRWSPDGERIGFSGFVPDPPEWKVDLPSPPEGADWIEPPRIVERLHYRADRRGFTEPGYTHLFTVPATGGTPRQITKGEWNVGFRFDALAGGVGWDWTPDGETVIVEGYKEGDPDQNYRDSYLYAVDVESQAVRRLTPERGTWTSPIISPDGRRIAFIGYPYTPQTYRAADLYVMDIDGSGMRKISGDFDRDPEDLTWAQDGRGVYFTADNRGKRNVYFAPLSGGVRPVTDGEQVLILGSVARNGVAVGVRTTPRNPPDVVRFDLRRPEQIAQLTNVNEDLLDGIVLGEVEEIEYTSTDGTRIQGWIVKPPFFDPAKKYPLLLEIHGGPHSMYSVGFSYAFQNFAANDFVVLYTNPRGSTGYGSEFGNAINYAYPSVDYEDLMAGVDAVLAREYIDPENLFVGGCSGGGVLSSWVIGHTDRFAAAAVRCPVTNWLSFAGQTDVPLFTFNFFEEPFWENPEPWLRQSPLMYVGNVQTPTLLMTGELDLRTPMAQTEEYYAALKMRGVPTTLLRFHNEYHGTGSHPSNFMRSQLYMMSWYERWGTFDRR